MSQIDLVYFDPESTGYHPGHVKIFSDRAKHDERVQSLHFVLGADFVDHDAWGILDSISTSSKLSFEYCSPEVTEACKPSGKVRASRRGRVRWNEARRVLSAKPGAIFFDSLFDSTLIGAALDRKPVPGIATGIVHFCAPALLGKAVFPKIRLLSIYALAKRREIPVVMTFDEIFLRRGPRYITDSWRFVPDPLPLSVAQFERLTSTSRSDTGARTQFLLFGSLGARKGVFSLLEAISKLDAKTSARCSFRILGKLTEGGVQDAQRFRQRIGEIQETSTSILEFEERFATEDELIDALAVCDVVLAPYLHHAGVSSVLIWAAAAGRPVLTQNSGWMSEVTESEKLGLTCDPSDANSLSAAITEASNPEWRKQYSADALRIFALNHSADHFYSAVIDQLIMIKS